jgi:hypothetical protein
MNLTIKSIKLYFQGLTKAQKKIVLAGALIFFSLLLFWLFIYRPQKKKFSDIKASLTQIESKTEQILSIASGKELPSAIKDLKVNFVELSGRLPAQEQTVIHALLETAKNKKIEVKNITPLGRNLVPSAISGCTVEELPFKLQLACEYRTLGEFLDILRNNFPVLVKVRHLNIKGTGEGRVNLNSNLEIQAYLSKEK